MSMLENFVSPALTRALGWTLLHSLWQGALVAAVLAGALLLLRRQRAEVRYVASAGALGMVVALAGITFGLYFSAGSSQEVLLTPNSFKTVKVVPADKAIPVVLTAADTPVPAKAGPAANAQTEILVAEKDKAAMATTQPAAPNWLVVGLRYFDNHLPLFVLTWMLGLLAMSLRMLGGLLYVQRLRRYRVRPLSKVWQDRLADLAARSGARRPIALLESALVQVPLVVGHVRPVILLPLGTVAGLSPAYLEAILAHELAHVLRRDYLVNLLQTVAEVLFFYHPAVWFVANCVRTERENCCDDTATALCGGDSLRLARALTALAEWSQSAVVPTTPRLALAAIGGRGALLNRVRRLVQRRPAAPTLAEGIMAGALVLGGLGLLGSSMALAGPLSRSGSSNPKPVAFDWQGGALQDAPKLTGAGDTSKRVISPSAAGSVVTVAEALQAPVLADDSHHLTVVPDEFGVNRLVLEEDTIIRGRASRRRPGRVRDNRRVIINGRQSGPSAFRTNPGTVVITKDKKGRLTDLVVNGQRVDTNAENGKSKLKIKEKKGKNDQQVEIIRVVPQGSSDFRSYVYRNDGGTVQFERVVPRTQFRTMPPSEPFIYRDMTPGLNQLGQLNRLNGTYRVITPGAITITDAEALRAQQEGLRTLRESAVTQRESLRTQRESLRTAESALRRASAARNLSAAERKSINKGLEEVRAQIRAMDRTAASQGTLRFNGADNLDGEVIRERRVEVLRERQQELQERQQELQERRQELQERIRESQRELRDLDHSRTERNRQNHEALVSELLKDGLIKDRNNFQLRLSLNSLVVDGKEQPKSVLQKYLKLYEANTGRKLTSNGSMIISRNGDMNGDNLPAPPAPPAPPRAPRAMRPGIGFTAPAPPMAPSAPSAPSAALPPAPPRPPKAPSLDTQSLRNELRKDGLIGQDDKGFQMQLNASGLTVNGKRQPDELAAKYRKMVGHDGPGQVYNLTISNQE